MHDVNRRESGRLIARSGWPDCALLRRIELDKFRVFEKEYRLSKPEKAGRITAQLFKSFWNLPRRASV
jgi:hypothetical protein